MDSDTEESPFKKPCIPPLPAAAVNKVAKPVASESANPANPQSIRRRLQYLEDDDFTSSSDEDNEQKQSDDFFYSNNNQKKSSTRNNKVQQQQPKEDNDFDDFFGDYDDFTSQRNSQLSQIRTQVGQFTYHSWFEDVEDRQEMLSMSLNTRKPQNDRFLRALPSIRDKSFFHSIRGSFQAGLYQMLASTLNDSYQYFLAPSALNLDFLRQFLRCYSKLTVERFASTTGNSVTGRHQFKKVYANYLNFFRYFFTQIASLTWKRRDVLELLHYPKAKEAPHDFFFSLMGHIMRLCLKYKQFNLDPLSAKVHLNLQLPFELFKIIITFLCDDFASFLSVSDNYAHDMNNLVSDVKPLMVRMMWDEPRKKPDYMPRVMKFYISYLVKAIKLDIYQMSAPMMKLYADLSEVIRICAGNIRPYLELSSSRLIVAQELFDALKKEGELTRKWDKVNIVLCELEEYPWLKAQFCVALLSNQYINLNQHFHKGKYKLSLRLILCTFLAGDVNGFKYEVAEFGDKRKALKKERLSLKMIDEGVGEMNMDSDLGIGDDHSKPQDEEDNDEFGPRKSRRIRETRTPNTSLLASPTKAGAAATFDYMNPHINSSNLEVLYRKYSTGGEKTPFGGTSLHIAARRGDFKWIESLFDVVDDEDDVNRADVQGYTALNDAARFGHEKCVEKLIGCSRETGTLLDYEAASMVDGATALHNAVMSEKEGSIRKILEFGGRHLLKIRNFAGETPEELLPENLKTLPHEITYRGMTNLLPSLKDLDDAEIYGRTVAALITSYLETIKLATFINLYRDYQEDTEGVLEERPEDDLEQHFRYQFALVWGRQPTEQEVDHLVEDVEMLPRIRQFVNKFAREQMPAPWDPDSGCSTDGDLKDGSQKNVLAGYFELLLMDVDCLVNKMKKLGVKFEDEK